MALSSRMSCLVAILVALVVSLPSGAQTCVSLTGAVYNQDFNSLPAFPNAVTSNIMPAGWRLSESGSGLRLDQRYTIGTGSDNTGDTYDFGSLNAPDRALGMLRSGTLVPIIGACFTNNTGTTLTSLGISYKGEQWRLGTTGRADRIDFQYSTNATSLTTGTYTDVDALDFSSPNTVAAVGALNGNLVENRTAISATISGLSIPNGTTFFIRWTDFDASGADDGLAVDDFSLTTNPTQPLSVTTTTLPAATVGLPYSATLLASGGSGVYTAWAVIGGSLGNLALNPTTGVISGTPNAMGTLSFTAQVTDSQNSTANKGLSITVNAPVCAQTHTIAQIQGNGNTSPQTGNAVTTRGIVTATKSNGFFIQMPAPGDGDSSTSDGMFVFTSSAPPSSATVGTDVCVAGTVQEFTPSGDTLSLSLTEITTPTVTAMASSQPLPPAVVLNSADMNPSGNASQLEKYEGMRVQVNSLTVVGPTDGNLSEANATSTSNGIFFGVISGTARPFREPGVDIRSSLPGGAPCCVPRFDSNPEILRVDSGTTSPLDVTTGVTVNGLMGVLDYTAHFYTLRRDPGTNPSVSGNVSFTAVPDPLVSEFTVANMNLERFYDTTNDTSVSDVVLTATAFNNRLNKVSLGIRNVLKMPDIIGVEEVENLATLQAVAAKVNADAVAAGQPNPGYSAYLVEGNDVGGIDVGFLVKSRVTVVDVTQVGSSATYIDPTSALPALLNDRPPLVLRASVIGYPVTVIVNHLRSLNGVDDPADGPRVRAKRQAQAEFLANLIQARQTADPTERIVSVGDYNAFEFSDGYVDMIGTIQGTPTLATQVILASSDLVNPDLTELTNLLPANQRYSYSFDGSAQELDHILVNQPLMARFNRFAVARLNADFPEAYRNDPSRPERLSDHDWPVVYFSFPPEFVNASPVTTPDTVSTLEDTPLTFAASMLKTNDTPGPSHEGSQTLTVTAVSPSSVNGGIVSLTAGNVSYLPVANFNGADSFTYTVCDNGTTYGLPDPKCSTGTVNVTVIPVNDPPVATSSAISVSVQYSDSIAAVTFTGSDIDSPGTALSAAVSWKKVGDPSFQNTTPLGGLTLSLAATGVNTRQWTLSGRALVAPGSYVVRVVVNDGQFSALADVGITVTNEDARASYTGALFASTSCATCSGGTVTLSATIQDISAVAGSGDSEAGDIRNATVTFVNLDTNTPVSPAIPVALISSGDTLTGSASFSWNVDIGPADSQSFTIGVMVGNFYVGSDSTLLTVSKPTVESATGGGFLMMESSSGMLAGAPDSKSNFGFNVKFNKSGKNAQGHFNALVRSNVTAPVGSCPGTGLRIYRVKSTAMGTFAVQGSQATFETKANIQDVTDPANPCTVDGNARLVVTLTDNGEPGSSDTLGITLWQTGGALWFSSFWNGVATVERMLGGGNLQVR